MKRTTHYSEAEKFVILKDSGIGGTQALELARVLDSYTFDQLDCLEDAVKVIRRGKDRI